MSRLSSDCKSNKPELIAIYRLEFYRNKKKWKLSNERRKEPRKPVVKVQSKEVLNETYDLEPREDVEKDNSPLNRAFVNEIPTDNDVLESSPTQGSDEWPDDDLWSCQPPTREALDIEGFTNRAQIGGKQQPDACRDPRQLDQGCDTSHPSDNPRVICKDPGRTTTNVKQPESIISNIRDLWSKPPPNKWSDQAFSTDPAVIDPQKFSKPQPAANSLHDEAMLANLLKRRIENDLSQNIVQVPPPGDICLEMLSCPHACETKATPNSVRFKDQCPSPPKLGPKPYNEPSVLQNLQEMSEQPHSRSRPHYYTPHSPAPPAPCTDTCRNFTTIPTMNQWHNSPVEPDIWSSRPYMPVADTWTHQTQNDYNVPGRESSVRLQQLSVHDAEKPSREVWCESEQSKVPWIDPKMFRRAAPLHDDDVTWQKQRVSWENTEQNQKDNKTSTIVSPLNEALSRLSQREQQNSWEWEGPGCLPGDEDVLDGRRGAGEEYPPIPGVGPPWGVRDRTEACLQQLLRLYHAPDSHRDGGEHMEGLQRSGSGSGGDSVCDSDEFVLGAHDVPHSSEIDPSERDEWRSAGGRVARGLRALLAHLRDPTQQSEATHNVVELPTRDTDASGADRVLAGSHLTHAWDSRDPHHPGTRVIKIDMGRPYRL